MIPQNPILPRTYVIVLNYNNWEDTIECLESLFGQHDKDFRVVVCDNGSQDNSLEKIRQWSLGELSINTTRINIPGANDTIAPKPIRYQSIEADKIKNGSTLLNSTRLVLLGAKENLGFSGGNNIGIQVALMDKQCEYIWLLNNDTVIDQLALDFLIKKMSSNQNVGILGSTILYYHDTSIVQALGGFTYNRFLGLSRQLGHLKRFDRTDLSPEYVTSLEKRMFGIQGASIFMRKTFLQQSGLLSEDYFLYSEELDLSMQNTGCFTLGYAPESIVYHKEGKTTGSDSRKGKTKSLISEYYLATSRLLFTQKYFPRFLSGVCFAHLLITAKRFFHGNWENALVVLLSTIFFMNDRNKNGTIRNDRGSFKHFLNRVQCNPMLHVVGEKMRQREFSKDLPYDPETP